MERLDLGQLRELARELASRRETAYAEVQAEVETMKAWLRERAAAVAERERELAELSSRLGLNGLAEELAALRIELEHKRAPTRRPPPSARQRELDDRQAALDEREAALDNRERMLRGDTMSFPAPLSFDDGLAGLAHNEPG